VAAVEAKVKAGAGAGALTGAVAWALVAFVPAFKSGLPPGVAALLPFAVTFVSSTVAAYLAPHTVRAGDPPAVPVSAAPTV